MYARFPELVLPPLSHEPTPDGIESGEWCFPDFQPDESCITLLDPKRSVISQFAEVVPEYSWFSNDKQTIAAVSSLHIPDPNNDFYEDLRRLYGHFVAETKGRQRVTLNEGRLWPSNRLKGSDADIITDLGDGRYLQSLSRANEIECRSTEPVKDKDILAVMQNWPELKRAAVMYVKMRMLPQAYRRQQTQQGYARTPILNYFRRFMDERQEHHGYNWVANHLYSINPFEGPGCINGIARHISTVHDSSVTPHELVEGPSKEIVDQTFRCTNSPVYHEVNQTTDGLCDVQKVAVLVNRLRDRRIAYILNDLGRRSVSYFWMSGPLHYEMAMPGLSAMAENHALIKRDFSAQLGLKAIKAGGVQYLS